MGNKQLTTTACEFLREFNRLCGQITSNGRVIPFNSLRLPFYQRWDVVCCTDDEELLYSNLTSNTELKLRYLEVWRAGNFEASDGICYRLVRALLEKKSYEIRRLEIDCSPIFEEFYQDDNAWNPKFSELEVLDIAPGFDAEKDGPEAKRKETTRWLLKNAPNLKKIVIDQLTCLKIVPAEILMTVELVLAPEFGFCVEKEEDIRSLPTMPDKVCGIMQGIYINSAPFFNYLEHTENVGEMEGELRGWNPLHHFETTLEGVLRNEHKNLERITLHDAYPVGRLSHPPLSNLSSIAINTMKVRNHSQVWNAIASINFERAMPNLKEVTIILTTNCWDPWNGWPTANQDISPFCCISAHKLKLEFGFQEINLSPLQAMFPNLSHISLTFVHREVDQRDLELLKQIMESWPRLVELEFSGVSLSPWSTLNPPIPNYDADFLGIHEEEAELLRREDDDFLRNVHIVPIRPSLLTMPGEFSSHESLVMCVIFAKMN